MENTENIFPHERRRSPELRRQDLIDGLKELRLTPAALVKRLEKFGDDREFDVAKRSIDRMISGETNVSAEMSIIVSMLLRQHRRLQDRYRDMEWKALPGGGFEAQIDTWLVYLSPQTRGRWLISCRAGPNREDYSPPWGHWLDSLEEAKFRALVEVEEGMNELSEIKHESRLQQ